MSDASSKNAPSTWGTIFSGGREHTLGGLEQSRSTAWSADDEAAYLERVKAKAAAMAERILADGDADLIGIAAVLERIVGKPGVATPKEVA